MLAPVDYESILVKDKSDDDKNKILKQMRESTDFLRGNFSLISIFAAFACPFFMNIFIMLTRGENIAKLFVGYEFLTDAQKDVLIVNLMFSTVQTFSCFWYYFNPLLRVKFKKWNNCALISSFISAITMLGVVPLA